MIPTSQDTAGQSPSRRVLVVGGVAAGGPARSALVLGAGVSGTEPGGAR